MSVVGERCVVTGASGFIGRRLCARLDAEGAEVHAVSRRPREAAHGRWWQLDLVDSDAVARTIGRIRPATVYHLAGYVSGSRAPEAAVPSLRDNLVATVNVLVAAERAGCTVVLTGSMEEPQSGDEEPVPVSPYAAAKHAAGAWGRMFHALHGLPVINLRVFMVYGPGQEDRSKLVPYVVNSLLEGVRPKLSSGARPVDWVYVDDVVDAFIVASSRIDLAGKTVDVGSGQLVTIRAVVEQIVAIVGAQTRPEYGAVPDRPLEVVRAADVERTTSLLGWQPRTPLAAGLRATVDWYRDGSRVSGMSLQQRVQR